MARLDKRLTPKDAYYNSAMAAFADAIKCVCTTILGRRSGLSASRGSLFETAEAVQQAGVYSSLCHEVSGRDGEKIKDWGIRENIGFIYWAERENAPTLGGKFGFHASMALSSVTLGKCREAIGSGRFGYHVHVAERPEDEKDSRAGNGGSTVERFFRSFGITGERSIFAHCIHINEREREIIKETNTAVAHNPEPNVGNALRRHFQKHPNIGRAELPAMLIDNKAEIAGRTLPLKLGRFKEGYAADAALTDYLPPTELSAGNINGHLLFRASGHSAATATAGGKVLMKDRKLTSPDRDEIFAKAEECAPKGMEASLTPPLYDRKFLPAASLRIWRGKSGCSV